MKKITIFPSLMFIAMLIANPAVIMPMEPNLENPQTDAMQMEESCSVCLSDGPSTDFRQLRCGHRFCVECLKDLLRLGLDEEWAHAMAARLRCPKQRCNYQMNEDDVQTISGDPARVARYLEILTHLFINTNRNFKHCPMANCEVVYELGPNPQIITCDHGCQAQYCSHCQQPHRLGEPCEQASAPLQNTNAATNSNLTAEQEQERQHQEWLRQNTKACPRCRVNIEKNNGCNHMKCTSCRHEFCWQCLAHWRNPGQNGYNEFARTHEGFYRCNAAGANAQQHGPRLHQNVIELLINEDRNPLPILDGYFRQNRNDNIEGIIYYGANNNAHAEGAYAQALAALQLLITNDANIDQQNHGEARPPLPIEERPDYFPPAFYVDPRVALDPFVERLERQQAQPQPAPQIAAQDHRAIRPQLAPGAAENFTITEPGRYLLEEPLPRMPFAPFMPNHNAQGQQAQPQPAPQANQDMPARLIEELSADDDLEDLPILLDGQNWRARMNSFAANEAAQREQNRK